jgi:nucleoside triphosphate diphosphatase
MSSRSSGESFARLNRIMAILRSPDGCPWDAEQTPESLVPYIVEEAYEVIEAIQTKDPAKICEELGDLLLQVVFQAQIHDELGLFDAADVATGIGDKLVRRHPHVFSQQRVANEQELHQQWERIKQHETKSRGEEVGILKGVPRTLPALQRAQKILTKIERFGYSVNRPIASMSEPTQPERAIAVDLFKIVNRARLLGIDAETALRNLCQDFQKGFESREQMIAAFPDESAETFFWEEFWSAHPG